jgi:hypothetical protein
LLLEAWRKDVKTVSVSNILARRVGVSPRHKTRALAQSEERGLVKVERHKRRAPRATLLEVQSPPEIEGEVVDAALPDSPPARPYWVPTRLPPTAPNPPQRRRCEPHEGPATDLDYAVPAVDGSSCW